MKENDIRPETLFDTYLSLAENDVKTYFGNVCMSRIPCPACGSVDTSLLFEKMQFHYEICNRCNTLFVNPRPDAAAFFRYYTESPSVEFWATHFYKETEEVRREQLIRPKALKISEVLKKYCGCISPDSCIVDIGAGYGVFCEELRQVLGNNSNIIAIEPSSALQNVCIGKGIPVIKKFLEETERSDILFYRITCATAFELLEHVHDPDRFIKACHTILDPGSLLILTTLNWEGFDLQMLGEKSRSIHPPHHINFFTTRSIMILLERWGFEVLDVSTPGNLDVDIAYKQQQDVKNPFMQKLLKNSDEFQMKKLQEIIQDVGMSSHMMIIARKGDQGTYIHNH
jgi:2-polyprenyl-3-methyl-5-hydroxy-6-metoxy-1,4-benzoquinol methylase